MLRILESKLKLDGFACSRGAVATQEVDLTPYQGQIVRVYLDNNLKMVVNPHYDCFWQLAEMVLNPPQTQQIEKGIKVIEERETVYIHRDDTNDDVLDNLGGTVELIGFEWQNYRRGLEWDTACASNRLTITWLTERRPMPGEEYPVTIKKTREVTDMASVEVSLDLTKINIVTYELPV